MDRIHEISVSKFDGTLEELATEVGRMRYDALVIFLKALNKEINNQAEGDFQSGRDKLANELSRASDKLHTLTDLFSYIWREHCLKHMNNELKTNPSLLDE